MHRLAPLFALPLLACASETGLRTAPLPPADSPATTSAPEAPPWAAPDPDSPWGNLDPGEMPDDLLAIAWIDLTESCVNCTYGPNTPSRYDLVDVTGQVVAAFTLPFEPGVYDWYRPELVGLHALGPGRFLASNIVQEEAGHELVVWEADGFEGRATVLARLRPGEIELPLAGTTRPLPTDDWVYDDAVLPDPTDPQRLLVVPTAGSPYLPLTPLRVWSVSTSDPESPIRTWDARDLLPPSLVPDDVVIEAPWFARLADDGSGKLVLGVTGYVDVSEPDDKHRRLVPYPVVVSIDLDDEDAQPWLVPTDGLGLQRPPLVAPPSPDRPGSMLWTPQWCTGVVARWQEGTTEHPLSEDGACPELALLIDAASPTFVYSEWQETYVDQSHRLVVHHGGEDVWTVDALRVGLAARPFHMLKVAAVPAE